MALGPYQDITGVLTLSPSISAGSSSPPLALHHLFFPPLAVHHLSLPPFALHHLLFPPLALHCFSPPPLALHWPEASCLLTWLHVCSCLLPYSHVCSCRAYCLCLLFLFLLGSMLVGFLAIPLNFCVLDFESFLSCLLESCTALF